MAKVNINDPEATSNNIVRDGASIGKILLELGKIKAEDAEKILRIQKEEGLRFGDAAIRLGLISEVDIQQVLAMQFDYPYLLANKGGYSKDLVAAFHPFSSQVEALRALRSQLIISWFYERNKSLAVIAAKNSDGCSFLAANLAVVFSQLGKRTLLIDANLRDPSQHKMFNLTERLGLSDILAGRVGFETLTKIDAFVDLTVLGAGTIPPNPQELLSRSNFNDFINRAEIDFDIVIVDTAPASEASDALMVAKRCGGALLVTRLNQTRLSDLRKIRDELKSSNVQIVSAVVNDRMEC